MVKNTITIAVDFDGTCVTHQFPDLGHEIGAAPVLKSLVDNGHKLILFTMRSNNNSLPLIDVDPTILPIRGDFLQQAVDWFKSHDIPLYGVQKNPTQDRWTTSPKCYAQLYLDDAALGVPLRNDLNLSERPFVDWVEVEKMLIEKGLI